MSCSLVLCLKHPEITPNFFFSSSIWPGSILKLIPSLNSYGKATPEFLPANLFGIRQLLPSPRNFTSICAYIKTEEWLPSLSWHKTSRKRRRERARERNKLLFPDSRITVLRKTHTEHWDMRNTWHLKNIKVLPQLFISDSILKY